MERREIPIKLLLVTISHSLAVEAFLEDNVTVIMSVNVCRAYLLYFKQPFVLHTWVLVTEPDV